MANAIVRLSHHALGKIAGSTPLLFASLPCLLIVFASAGVAAQTPPSPYVEFPFDVRKGNTSIDEEVLIIEERPYYAKLIFSFADRTQQDRLSQLLGDGSKRPDGRYGKPGIIIPIRLVVTPSGRVAKDPAIFDQTVDTQGIDGTEYFTNPGAGAFVRSIAELLLQRGTYRFRATTLREVPAFPEGQTMLAIVFDTRDGPLRHQSN